MSQEFVHTSAVILTDDMFLGGDYIGTPQYTGTAAQRNVAYLMAEQAMIRELQTPLLPTTITGTWMWPQLHGIGNRTLVLPFAYIRSVESITVLYGGGTGTCGLQTTAGCHRIRDDSFGYLDIYCLGSAAQAACRCGLNDIYQVQVAYTAGLSTGTAADHLGLHMALCMIAEEHLNEIVDPGANPGGPGAPGIESYSSLGYTERLNKMSLKMTSMGASARMNSARRAIEDLRRRRALIL